jgi:peptide chain release factor 3
MVSEKILQQKLETRRTFAIISHPDAGKTTMTERLLLMTGAVQIAGSVKARKSDRFASSDWMAMERDRGISVTTSVMRLEYEGFSVNLLDTPGHNDFSEDTYRTLTAVDSALMMIDCAKGVEKQTIKLMGVCRMQKTPIVTFMNKLDRNGLEPFELLENVEEVLGMDCVPITWPVGMGQDLKGIYHLQEKIFFKWDKEGEVEAIPLADLNDPAFGEMVGEGLAEKVTEEIELLDGAGAEFSPEAFLSGSQTPVFFGSAINGFGVQEMFDHFLAHTPIPGDQATETRTVSATESKVTGFIFKIQANMDPNHRDRLAFMRICSGRFHRGQKLHNVRLGRDMKMANPVFFLARDRNLAEEAWPGDIVGVYDQGSLEIGDSFSEGEPLQFTGIPSFAPEIFRRVVLEDPLKAKNLKKGLEQLAQEGAVQLFRPTGTSESIVGVVGQLQLEVLQARLLSEYRVRGRFENVELATARWYRAKTPDALVAFERKMKARIAVDVKERKVFMAESAWRLRFTQEEYKEIEFFETSDGLKKAELLARGA